MSAIEITTRNEEIGKQTPATCTEVVIRKSFRAYFVLSTDRKI
jgi:hypothetical protein